MASKIEKNIALSPASKASTPWKEHTTEDSYVIHVTQFINATLNKAFLFEISCTNLPVPSFKLRSGAIV